MVPKTYIEVMVPGQGNEEEEEEEEVYDETQVNIYFLNIIYLNLFYMN